MQRSSATFVLVFSLLSLSAIPAQAAERTTVVTIGENASPPANGTDHGGEEAGENQQGENGGAQRSDPVVTTTVVVNEPTAAGTGPSAANGGTTTAQEEPVENAQQDDEDETPSCSERLAAAIAAFPATPFAQFFVAANRDLYAAQSAPFILNYLHTLSVIYRGYIGPILANPDVVLPFCIIHFIFDMFSYVMQTGPLQQCGSWLMGEDHARRLPYILFAISTAIKTGLQPDPHFAAISLFLISRTMPWALPESTRCYRLWRNFVNWLFFYICYEFAPTPYGGS